MENPELRYASTVILVRDSENGVEMLLQERSGKSESFSGAFVFPGGKVDLHDADKEYETLYSGHTDPDASAILGVPKYGLAYWMGGIREVFEEAGILLAYDKSGKIVSFNSPSIKQRFIEYRDALNKGEMNLLEICREEELTLATDQMYYYSHWVTPIVMPRRFDTRFFICRAPAEQEPIIDNHEVVSQCWINPAEALRKQREEGFQIFFPTIKNIQGLTGHEQSQSLLEAVAQFRDLPRILPIKAEKEGAPPLIPGDEGYVHREVATPHYS